MGLGFEPPNSGPNTRNLALTTKDTKEQLKAQTQNPKQEEQPADDPEPDRRRRSEPFRKTGWVFEVYGLT